MSPQRKRIAVVGAGGMGRFHVRTLLAMDDVEVGAVADPFPHPELEALGVAVSTNPVETASQGWDGVVVASTDESHAELTLAALAAGSRVLCEKPLSDSLAGAATVVDAEVATGQRRVQVGFMRRYDPAHLAVVEQLGDLGPVRFLRCTHRNTNDAVRPPRTVVNQSIIHDIHTITWLLGPTASASTTATTRPDGLEDVMVVVRMTSGAMATVEFQDNTYAYEVEIEASGPRGMVRSASPYQALNRRLTGEMEPHTDWFGWFTTAYEHQDRAWVDSLAGPAAIGPSAWDGYESQLVSEAALHSLDDGGRFVAVDRSKQRPALYG